ncbi:MAG: hypothetical protein V1690_03920 [Candidatus Moraniibacteriota bacterium]
MKKTVVILVSLAILMSMVFAATACAMRPGGFRCIPKSWDMKNSCDALIWRMANPNECGMDFLGYEREVKGYYGRLQPQEASSDLVKALIQKHIGDLVRHLQNDKVHYFEAIEHKGYYESLDFFEKQGYEIPVEKPARWYLLQKKYRERFDDIMKELRSPTSKKDRNHSNVLAIEALSLAEKMYKSLGELGSSSKELSSFRDK